MNIGKALKLCRTQKSLSKTELANLSGLSVSYISLLENNRRDPPMSTIEKLCTALNIPVVIFVFLASDMTDSVLSSELTEKLSLLSLQLIGS